MKTITALAWMAVVLLALPSLADAQDDAEKRFADKLQAARELYASGNWETAKEAYGEIYSEAPDGTPVKAEAALEKGSILWEQGRYKTAEKHVEESLELARKLDLDHVLGRLLLTLGHIEASRGEFRDAESTLKICIRMAEKKRDGNYAALCRMNRRFVRQLQAKSVGSEAKYRRDLKTLEASGAPLLVGTALAKSAELREKAGDHVQALDLLRRAHAQFEKGGSVPAKARNRMRLARLYQNLGQWKEAGEQLDGLIVLFKNMGNRPALVTAHVLAGKQAVHDGDAAAAMRHHQNALKLASGLDSPQTRANAELAMCEFLGRTSESDQAGKHCRRAAKGFAKAGVPELAARARIVLARQAQMNGNLRRARTLYIDVIEGLEEDVADNSEYRRNIATQRVNLCQVEMKLKANGAHQRCREALDGLQSVKATDRDYRDMLAATHYAVGATAERAGEKKEARENLKKAAELSNAVENHARAADALLRLGNLLQEGGKAGSSAADTFRQGLKAAKKAPDQTVKTRIQLRIQLAQILMDAEEWKKARTMLTELHGEAKAAEDTYSMAWGRSAIARVHLKLGDRDEAIAALKDGIPLAKKADDDELAAMMERNLSKLQK